MPELDLPVEERWFERRRIDDDITLLVEPHVDLFLRSDIWHVRGRDRDLLVDTGNGIAGLRRAATDLFEGRETVAVVTHGHGDHMGGLHEFEIRAAHPADIDFLKHSAGRATLFPSDFDEPFRREMEESGYPMPDLFITALPSPGFDPAAYAVMPAPPTLLLGEGDLIDLGDRAFEVLHLPGHTPGSIGLWEEATGTLFSGDAVYRDGPLLDQLPESDIGAYLGTMRRLRELPVTVVHGGHDPSFGRERLIEIVDGYLASRGVR